MPLPQDFRVSAPSTCRVEAWAYVSRSASLRLLLSKPPLQPWSAIASRSHRSSDVIDPQRFLEQLRSDAFDIANDPELGGLRIPALARAVLDRLEDAGVSGDSQLAYYRQ